MLHLLVGCDLMPLSRTANLHASNKLRLAASVGRRAIFRDPRPFLFHFHRRRPKTIAGTKTGYVEQGFDHETNAGPKEEAGGDWSGEAVHDRAVHGDDPPRGRFLLRGREV